MSCNCCVKALGIIFPNVFLLKIVTYRLQKYNKMFNITNILEKIFIKHLFFLRGGYSFLITMTPPSLR